MSPIRTLLSRGEVSLSTALSHSAHHNPAAQLPIQSIKRASNGFKTPTRQYSTGIKPNPIIAPKPVARDYIPDVSAADSLSAVAVPTSQLASRQSILARTVARIANRKENIVFDDVLAERVVDGEPMLYYNADEKARVEALAEEIQRDRWADQVRRTGEMKPLERVKVADCSDEGMSRLVDWSVRGIPSKTIPDQQQPEKKKKKGRVSKKDKDAAAAAAAVPAVARDEPDIQIAKAMYKNRSFNSLDITRFKDKFGDLL